MIYEVLKFHEIKGQIKKESVIFFSFSLSLWFSMHTIEYMRIEYNFEA